MPPLLSDRCQDRARCVPGRTIKLYPPDRITAVVRWRPADMDLTAFSEHDNSIL